MVANRRLVPARVAMIRVPETEDLGWATGHDVYPAAVVDHEGRNGILVEAIKGLLAVGKRTLVLTKEVRHAEALSARIPGSVQVDGQKSEIVERTLLDLQAGAVRCVVGTSVIGEGVDVPAADALVYAAAGRSRVKVVQDYFRVLTASPGKTRGIVIDAADQHHPSLLPSAACRLALYRSEEAFTSEVIDPGSVTAWIMENR